MNLEQIAYVAYVFYLETWTTSDEDVADLTDERLQELGVKWRKECLPNRKSKHCGDCTNVPGACHRCQMDALFKTAERILRSNAVPGSATHGATYHELDEANAALSAENSRLRAGLERISVFPVHSEPVGSAYAMQDIALEALSPNVPDQRPGGQPKP